METSSNQKPTKIETDWLLSNFAQFEKGLNGGAKLPLHSKRKLALENYQKSGFPNTSLEEWKYTNPAPIQERAFPLIQKQSQLSPEELTKKAADYFTSGLDSIRVTICNGQITIPSEELAGVKIFSLKQAQANKAELSTFVDKHLACYANSEEAFVAMNTSLLEDAVIISIAKKAQVAKPIEILFHNDENATEKSMLPRVLVVAEANSEATIIENYSSTADFEYSSNSVIEFVVGENTSLNHYRVQNESTKAFHVSTIAADVAANANFRTYTFSFGGKLVRNNVYVTLNGSNCNIVMNGLTVINGKQHVDNHTYLDNTQPNCESNELYKGIYADASQGVFSGSIIVRQAAQKTNAIQSNKSLLLSDEAGINTKPQLKIWADDVKCTHGATIGQLDDDALFYIRSRGVSEKDAKVMLVHAFASEVVSGVAILELKERLEDMLLKKLKIQEAI